MQKYLIVTPSVTYALKGRDALRRQGMSAKVERINGQNGSGCGYGIVTDSNLKRVNSALNSAGVKIIEIKDY